MAQQNRVNLDFEIFSIELESDYKKLVFLSLKLEFTVAVIEYFFKAATSRLFPLCKPGLYYPQILLARPPGFSLGWSLPAVRII